ncbi:outer membrane beta-barrel family protein [Ancylomarina longa]|uniref:TonB-dependent receptor n=1 Tax=Ancylomarina longa TaxID=2487017 RepID=A0A434ATQ9_9BACT|nr:outer membrane beta-barrel family protein [Ancylomarina longa]RUT77803.1 TonB-dependent receptor [Ancylomarina longa]
MIKKTTLSLLIIILSIVVNAASLKGKIQNHNQALEYFTAAILSSQDSSILTGGAFMDGYFEFPNLKVDKCLLQISCVGYQTITKPIDFRQNSSIDIGTIQMKNLELKEVIVRAKRPTFRQVEGLLVINVKGTSLSQAGDLFDALKRSPGLIVDNNNNISVLGKGTPIVFINNREVKNKAEIESLQSDDIASIEIDRNPSAEYSASGKAVVRIKTKKITKDKINLQLYHRSYLARKYSTSNGIQLGNKIGKTTSFINYSYTDYKYKSYKDAYEINTQENYIIENRKHSIIQAHSLSHNLFASINQEIGAKHNLGFQYSYFSKEDNLDSDADQSITKTDEEERLRNILASTLENNDLETYNLNYEFKIDSLRSLSLVADYSKNKDKSREDINEKNLTTNSDLKTLLNNRNDYDIYSGKVDYQTPIFKFVNLQSGIKLSKVKNNGKSISTDKDSNSENYNTEDKINDRITAAYFTLNRKFKRANLKGGLRYEYTNTDISSSGTSVLDSTYGNWFPSFLINKKFSDQLDLTLSYSKKIDRPRFSELSTDVTYLDSLSYSVGNPSLKPTISHNLDLSLNLFRRLSVNLTYSNEKNARIMGAINDKGNPDIVKYTPVNIDKAEYLSANIDYSYSGKKFNSTLSLGGEKPFIDIPYLGEIRKIRKASWYFQANNDYSITNRTTVFMNFWYMSSKKDLMTDWDNVYKLSVGMNTSFFDKKLNVGLLANDILNSSDSAYKDIYGNIMSGAIYDFDSSWVRISIKYNFNDFKGKIRKKSASESELNRL